MTQVVSGKAAWFVGFGIVLALLLVGLFFLALRRGKGKAIVESAEASRLLGLVLQGQGQLDKAYEKFCQCPMNEVLMEDIYNLGLDFERRRQFDKAAAAFRYLSQHHPKCRDLAVRLQRGLSPVVTLPGVEVAVQARRLICRRNNSAARKLMVVPTFFHSASLFTRCVAVDCHFSPILSGL